MMMYVSVHIIDLYTSEAACLEMYLLVGCTIKGWRPLDQFLFETDPTNPVLLLLLLEHPHPQHRLPLLAVLVLAGNHMGLGVLFPALGKNSHFEQEMTFGCAFCEPYLVLQSFLLLQVSTEDFVYSS